ncbi:MAG: cysteine desulfurase family protein [Actinomycetota bacterium]|nr:cysteine desulfurase family protein [Actinomycetota bacterium]
MTGRPIYLDYNATTPIDDRVLNAMMPFLTTEFGNPSSDHAYGAAPRQALAKARQEVATLVGASASEIVFTGSGSEADALAIRGAVLATKAAGRIQPHVITQVTEHPAVLAACRELEELHDVTVTYLPVDADGLVDPHDVEAAITSSTVLVSIMHANNETGTIQPIARIAAITKARGVLLHTDAAQSIGKIPVNVQELGVDLLTIVGHKMYAPKGIAALYVREGVTLHPIIGGGGQERGLRAGTENVAFAVGIGAAAQLATQALVDGEMERLSDLRDQLDLALQAALPGRVHVHGDQTHRLPNTLNVHIDDAPALALLAHLPDVAASAGSACHAGQDEPSAVLIAMGLNARDSLSTIRLSLGRWTTPEQVEQAAHAIGIAVQGLPTSS